MRTLALVTALAAVVSLPHGSAHAQEALPPATTYAPAPPYLPPPIDPEELARRGHHKKIAGAVLLGLGIGLTAVGIGLAIDGAWHAHCSGHEEHAVCEPSPATSEMELGTTGILVGQVMTIVGIPVYIVGGRQVAQARRLRF